MNQTKSILTLSLPIRPSSHFILRSWIKVHKTFHYTLNSFIYFLLNFWSDLCYCCPVTQSSPILCDPMDRSMPGLPVSHHLPEFAQVHVHCISDAIQPSHLLMPSSPPALHFSKHQGLFQWVGCSHQMTKILELQIWHQSFQRVFRFVLLQPKVYWTVGPFSVC